MAFKTTTQSDSTIPAGDGTADVRQEIDILTERLGVVRVQARDIADRTNELEVLERLVDDAKYQASFFEDAAKSVERDLKKKRETLERLCAEEKTLIDKYKKQEEISKKDKEEVEGSVAKAVHRLTEISKQITEKKYQAEEATRILSQIKTDETKAQGNHSVLLSNMEAEIAVATAGTVRAKEEAEKAKEEIEDMNKKRAEALAGLRDAEAEVQELREAREREILGMDDIKKEIQKERDDAEEQLFRKRKHLEDREGEISKQSKWLEEKREKLRKMKDQLEKHFGKSLNIII